MKDNTKVKRYKMVARALSGKAELLSKLGPEKEAVIQADGLSEITYPRDIVVLTDRITASGKDVLKLSKRQIQEEMSVQLGITPATNGSTEAEPQKRKRGRPPGKGNARKQKPSDAPVVEKRGRKSKSLPVVSTRRNVRGAGRKKRDTGAVSLRKADYGTTVTFKSPTGGNPEVPFVPGGVLSSCLVTVLGLAETFDTDAGSKERYARLNELTAEYQSVINTRSPVGKSS